MNLISALETGKPIKRPFMSDYLIKGVLNKALVKNAKQDRDYNCLVFKSTNDPIILVIEDLLASDWDVLNDNL